MLSDLSIEELIHETRDEYPKPGYDPPAELCTRVERVLSAVSPVARTEGCPSQFLATTILDILDGKDFKL